MEVVRLKKAQAPIGSGLMIRPMFVDRNIARSCHACGVTSTGFGIMKRIMRPIVIDMSKGVIFAPCLFGDDDDWIDVALVI